MQKERLGGRKVGEERKREGWGGGEREKVREVGGKRERERGGGGGETVANRKSNCTLKFFLSSLCSGYKVSTATFSTIY